VFIGDIMVVYSTYLEKENKNRSIMHADMTDKEAMMIATLLFLYNLSINMQKRYCWVMGYPLQILIYFPREYMTVVIFIGVLWEK
jgi:hypothetical protein